MENRQEDVGTYYSKSILEDDGVQQCQAEPALFMYYDGSNALIVVSLTDDFLCVYSHEDLFLYSKIHMHIFVQVMTQEGNSLKYVNVRIIQIDQGICIDQTHHIKATIINHWFPPGMVGHVKPTDTPHQTDSD